MILLDKDEALRQLEEWYRAQNDAAACTMCHLAKAAGDEQLVAESEHGAVVLDGFAASKGHLLVISREHVETSSDIDWPAYEGLSRLVWDATRTVERVLRPHRVYVAALGATASLPMSFPHYHVHVIPVYTTDERARPARVFSWSEGVVRYEPGEAEDYVRRLRLGWTGPPSACEPRRLVAV